MKDFPTKAFLSLGSNEGDSRAHLRKAIMAIRQLEKSQVDGISKLYRTAAWGKKDQPDFLNLVVSLSTFLEPEVLMESLILIEEKLGRVRKEKWGQRIIDIDILLYGNEKINLEKLSIPHPEMQNRKFVLVPLMDLDPQIFHPVLKKNMAQLLDDCEDESSVIEEGKLEL